MKRRIILTAAAELAVLFTLASCVRAEAVGVVARAERAAQLLFAPKPADAQIKEGLLTLLDAIVEAAPGAGIAGDWPSKIADARRILEDSPGYDKVAALLDECHREINGGAPFRMPETIHSIGNAVDQGRRNLESIRSLMQQGKAGDAVRRMLETLLIIMTPIEQGS